MTHPGPDRILTAALVMIAAMAIIGVIDNYIVRVADQIGLWQFHFVRALMALPLVAGLSLLGLGTLRPVRLWAVAVRSLLVGVSMLFYFSALALMPIAQALGGLFTSPIFILLITALVMKQRIGPWRICAVLLGFVGILLVLQPNPSDLDLKVMIPMAGGFFYALSAIATRTICARESTITMLAGMWVTLGTFGALGLVVLSIWPLASVAGPDGFVTRGWVWPIIDVMPLVVLQAVGSVIGVFLIIKAYQLGEPSYVSVFEYSVMIFGPLFAYLAFGQTVGGWQIFGIGCIACAGIIIALRAK
ncbi:MAG: DMT family transporter [Sedimentitalea sp.]